MRVLLSIIVAMSLGAWSLCSLAQDKVDKGIRGSNDSGVEEGRQDAVIDVIYPEEGRMVIDDREYFLEGSIIINNQEVSSGSVMAILREGQRLLNVVSERQDDDGRLVLRGVDTF
ncbi:MAG: hypothetical protein KBT82_08685 [Marinobacter sp.]|uniref:hypothetical protein n=1 Tax=Marinobacter sp. TaxID=50741 RepID=UPI001B478D7F|nr:hypothetical protein [Marinobacter sp.]MBQ0745834.1 hypothetical protein [Marinobacter sp.]MBQ0814238.1 hypothetical protein [Marinobacter sp.]|tara:strand:- start:423 stop:767 length:345 start_codon:yes stop_codon:yes gene_type:complete